MLGAETFSASELRDVGRSARKPFAGVDLREDSDVDIRVVESSSGVVGIEGTVEEEEVSLQESMVSQVE